jgi:hypothetical protein
MGPAMGRLKQQEAVNFQASTVSCSQSSQESPVTGRNELRPRCENNQLPQRPKMVRRFSNSRSYGVTRTLDRRGKEREAIGRDSFTLAILNSLMLVPCFVIDAQPYASGENIPSAKKTETEKALKNSSPRTRPVERCATISAPVSECCTVRQYSIRRRSNCEDTCPG